MQATTRGVAIEEYVPEETETPDGVREGRQPGNGTGGAPSH
jgi:hypothetical protein